MNEFSLASSMLINGTERTSSMAVELLPFKRVIPATVHEFGDSLRGSPMLVCWGIGLGS